MVPCSIVIIVSGGHIKQSGRARAYGESHVLRNMFGQLMTTSLADNPQTVQSTWTVHTWMLLVLACLPMGQLLRSRKVFCPTQTWPSVGQVLEMQQELLTLQWTFEGNLQGTIGKAGGFLASCMKCLWHCSKQLLLWVGSRWATCFTS